MMCYTKGSKKMLPVHWEGGARATLTSPLRGRKAWPPARARRKGGVGEFRRARAEAKPRRPARSEQNPAKKFSFPFRRKNRAGAK